MDTLGYSSLPPTALGRQDDEEATSGTVSQPMPGFWLLECASGARVSSRFTVKRRDVTQSEIISAVANECFTQNVHGL
ncbi:hypothetical protein TNCV_2291551 [Trichonephila clavipes]|uniref:Uncharacterized protein n=1 Tax=Trichonephila clavipes TaxID=2585209 RepID=A0A8X6RWG4_TRICX|nr:hypothetical protein TNCV_2291551 [Trichonephila clavipes]